MLVKSQWVNNENKDEITQYLNDNENTTTLIYGVQEKQSKREVYSNTILPQETRNISNKQSKLTPNANRERRTKNPKVSRGKEIIKIRLEINENKMKETIAKINKTKSWFFEKINKIDKPLARLIKKKRKKTESIELEMKKEK